MIKINGKELKRSEITTRAKQDIMANLTQLIEKTKVDIEANPDNFELAIMKEELYKQYERINKLMGFSY